MVRINLNGKWTLHYFEQQETEILRPEQLDSNAVSIEAEVPGNVELDMMRAGILPDVFRGSNIYCLKPFERYEYWYEKEFEMPGNATGRLVELVFHGVDCIATYWLNGKEIGRSDNMFIEHRFDITEALKPCGVNKLTVRLKSPVIEAMNKEYAPSEWALNTNWEQLWIRKAAHSYGWDIMPRAVSAGLWRDVEIVVREAFEIKDLYFYTHRCSEKNAKIGINYQLKLDRNTTENLVLEVEGRCGDSSFSIKKDVLFNAGMLEIEIKNPMLWWPRGYGEVNLYEVTTRLICGEKVLDIRKDFIGIRKVELIYSEIRDSGKSDNGNFLFKVNGVPILCKGSNWVAADAFHSRDAARYEAMLELFTDLNCNIIRCWGGNVYEDHAFFDLCDRNGIMVWQDFAMACACHPQEEEFFDKIRTEAVSVVKKLRNHPSIILWAGDNECDCMYYEIKGMDPTQNRITREVLPQVIFRHDPYRSYLPSSPYYSEEIVAKKDNSLMPEQHLWGPRDYFKSRFYTESTAYFTSEMGYHGCPNLSSIKRFIDEEYIWPWENNKQWIAHCTDPLPENGRYAFRVKLMADQIKELFGIYPDNIEDFILASQISQAEADKFFIEMTRLKKWRRTGVIWWNVIDGWPQFSDAVVDYYFGKKLAYHYIKRVQQPVCIMIDEPDNWHVRVVAGNDSCKDAEGHYKIWDADSKKTLLEGEFSTNANENTDLGCIRISQGEHRLFLIAWTISGEKYCNHYIHGNPPFSLDKYKTWLKSIDLLS